MFLFPDSFSFQAIRLNAELGYAAAFDSTDTQIIGYFSRLPKNSCSIACATAKDRLDLVFRPYTYDTNNEYELITNRTYF